jgi:prepilin-type N-terminal cleavage/methylation domain-containing protein
MTRRSIQTARSGAEGAGAPFGRVRSTGATTAGFSLVEVLIASAILAACLLPVVAFAQRGVVESGATQEDLLGRQILMDLCERYKASDPAELKRVAADPDLIESDSLLTPLRPAVRQDGAASGVTFRRSIGFVENHESVAGIHKITFTVAWASRGGKARRASLSRLIHWH